MKEMEQHVNHHIARLEFDRPALDFAFASMSKPVRPGFIDQMRKALAQHAKLYRIDLLTPPQVFRLKPEDIERQPDGLVKSALFLQKQLAQNTRANLAATRKAFELLGQNNAINDVELTVASNVIMQDLGNKPALPSQGETLQA